MDLITSTLRISAAGVASLDAVPSGDLRAQVYLAREDGYVRALAAFCPNKVIPLHSAISPVRFALSVLPDLLAAQSAYLLGRIRHSADLQDVREALFS